MRLAVVTKKVILKMITNTILILLLMIYLPVQKENKMTEYDKKFDISDFIDMLLTIIQKNYSTLV